MVSSKVKYSILGVSGYVFGPLYCYVRFRSFVRAGIEPDCGNQTGGKPDCWKPDCWKPNQTGEALQTAGNQTGEALQTAGNQTGEAVQTVGNRTGEGLQAVANKTGEALKGAQEFFNQGGEK